jgi:phenylalanyl-tRNA synthetase beta subunit
LGTDQVIVFEIGTIFNKGGEEMRVAYGDKKEVKEFTWEEFTSQTKEFFESSGEDTRPLKSLSAAPQKFKMWSLFPFIARDLAVWVGENIKIGDVEKVIKENAGDMVVRGPELFDEFKKDEKVSYAFRLVFQSYERTLTDAEINEVMNKIQGKIEENGWQVR